MSPSSDVSGRGKERELDVGSWGTFFIWIGVALLAGFPWGVWLIGVGAIVLGTQGLRRFLGLRVETFWLVVGCLFVLGGISGLAELQLGLAIIPVLCIVAGAGLIANALRHTRSAT